MADRYHIKSCNSHRGPQCPCDCSRPFKTERVMKPSPMLEDHDKNLEWALSVMGDAKSIDRGSIAYLMTMAAKAYKAALISAQPGVPPGGEGVTREALETELAETQKALRDAETRGWNDGVEYGAQTVELSLFSYPKPRADLAATIRKLKLRPTSPDPARATEERKGK